MIAWLKTNALLAALLALAVVASAAGVQTLRLAGEQRDHADTLRRHAQELAALGDAARQATEDARAEERRRYTALQEIVDGTRTELDAARADAVAAAAAGERLRQRLAAITAGCRGAGSDPGATAGGPAASSAADLLADVQRRLDAAADGIARHADAAEAAGRACERAYDALK
ncbi:DUF2514 family protein [Pseudothauera rhizosphaerae]|nr:DUF2514 family protein [Pseudothauera rhizosphaerae]